MILGHLADAKHSGHTDEGLDRESNQGVSNVLGTDNQAEPVLASRLRS